MNLIKTSLLSSIFVMIRVVVGFITNKVIALLLGPTGITFYGQFNNFVNIANNIAGLGINSGVVKNVAEFREDNEKLKKTIGTAFSIVVSSSTILMILIIIFSKNLSNYFFKSPDLTIVFYFYALFINFFSINWVILSIINGYRQVKTFIKINIIQSLVAGTLVVYFTFGFGLKGMMIAVSVTQGIVLIFALYTIRNLDKKFIIPLKLKFDKEIFKKYLHFSSMTLISAFLNPYTNIFIRNLLINKISFAAAGAWQAVNNISTLYLMMITLSVSTYYSPRLAEIKDKKEMKIEIINGYKIIMPLTIFLSTMVFILKDIGIELLYSKEFLIAKQLFLFQLIGDNLRIAAWLLSSLMMAKAMTKLSILSTISNFIIAIGLNYAFISIFGLIGTSYAYALAQLLYSIFVFFYFTNWLNKEETV